MSRGRLVEEITGGSFGHRNTRRSRDSRGRSPAEDGRGKGGRLHDGSRGTPSTSSLRGSKSER